MLPCQFVNESLQANKKKCTKFGLFSLSITYKCVLPTLENWDFIAHTDAQIVGEFLDTFRQRTVYPMLVMLMRFFLDNRSFAF